jgi:parallel beta-helix repeat protein
VTHNGDVGIQVDGNGSLIRRNTIEANSEDGIGVRGDNNTIRGNTMTNNGSGIVVAAGATSNLVKGNSSQFNGPSTDMVDDNPGPPCVNTWANNAFGSVGGDGGGCIQ